MSRRSRLKVWGALGSITVGFAFSYVVAPDDRPLRIFVLVVTNLGLFTVISGLIAQLVPVETLHEPAPPRDPEGARPVPRPTPPEPPTSEPNSPPPAGVTLDRRVCQARSGRSSARLFVVSAVRVNCCDPEERITGGTMATENMPRTGQTDETDRLISSDKVEGTSVYNRNGDNLGAIDHLMIDKISGPVEYAVMSTGGFLGIGESYSPVPWDSLTYDVNLGGYVIDADRAHLEKAQRFTSSAQPNWSDRSYAERVDEYWQVGRV